ncbi:GDP/UDP-N,N'-diacetylbacillosamine 2-epimerase (hydrolyzing) [Roseimaritima multifibrata]|uniref:GDP/UDP-N,N'-diacetylbacillosamine 2-epimerase (Hydrolyzing) n=1 Tax=Roseimaritima multifibrata TaxID=1930274 RepID=A0A517MLR0_9BACT|nr:UDP-N-acetylglucosamine 2-epimerase [Roseimaritima multifibrata]QDS95822.1 GDP/UDP-N,N'-diacetylbacillosamine 2-epimerase (hydrolyzing) [Roseimaritima multifibrata]
MRTVAVVTAGRSDWGIYLPVLKAIQATDELKLQLIVTGAHSSSLYGSTISEIEAAGFDVSESVEMLMLNDSPESIAKSMGIGMLGIAQVYRRTQPDILLVLGDRFEMHAAATAAVPFKLPIAHIHGGEVTEGAIDDAFRHSITKYSHLHFVSTAAHAKRVIQLGEEPWRVTVCGAPGLDNLRTLTLLTSAELEHRLKIQFTSPPLLVTFHPVTLEFEQTDDQAEQFFAALANFDMPIIVTKPNADTSGQNILQHLDEFGKRPNVRVVDNLGTQAFFSLMSHAAAMVGNSSSGIIETASFQLPTVNVGLRQHGRSRSRNVLDVDCRTESITKAIRQALSTEFRKRLDGMTNMYGNGNASEQIVERLKTEPINQSLLMKRFYDIDFATPPIAAG